MENFPIAMKNVTISHLQPGCCSRTRESPGTLGQQPARCG